jgi:pimeloyl-ACP methyl ester carboxylesterase
LIISQILLECPCILIGEHCMEKTEIIIRGLKITYLIGGKGKSPVFFLHGWGASKDTWELLITELNLNKTFVAVDFPGFGESDQPKEVWEMRDYADFVEEFMEAVLKKHALTEPVSLIVHSFGGRTAIKFFEKPRNIAIEKLVLLAPAGIKHTDRLYLKVLKSVARVGKAFVDLPVIRVVKIPVRAIFYKFLRTHDYEKLEGIMKEIFVKVINEDLSVNLVKINVPTLIIWGKNDSYVPVKDAYKMNEAIKKSTLVVIGTGRHAIHKTHAKELAELIRIFMLE